MGCFMNILWLMFGGIITAVEYLIASLLMMFIIHFLQQLLCQRQNHVKGTQLLCLGHTAGNLAKIMKLDFQRQRIPAEIGVLQSPHQLHCRMVQLYNDG